MSYLLDTNIVSEATKPQPSPQVIAWLAAQPDESLFLSAVTIGEIRWGILLLDPGRKRRRLLRWLDEEIKAAFAERILSADTAVMEHWAQLQAAGVKAGRCLAVMDSLIAATALAHDLTLVTRNSGDFSSIKLRVWNPWQAEPR